MDITKLELFSFENRSIETTFDQNGNVSHTEVIKEKSVVSYGMSNGEIRVDNPDGSGFTLMVNPVLTNKLLEWIQSNIQKSNEQEAHYRQQRDEEHEERMRSLQAETERNKLSLEEEKLRHEIRMTDLKIELAEKRNSLREVEKEAAD